MKREKNRNMVEDRLKNTANLDHIFHGLFFDAHIFYRI